MSLKDILFRSQRRHGPYIVYSDFMGDTLTRTLLTVFESGGLTECLRGPIVDFGCGSGYLLHRIRAKDAQAIGIDLLPTRAYEDIQYLKRDMRDTGLPGNYASLVISNNIADYFDTPAEFDAIFREADRILQPGGVFAPMEFESHKLMRPFYDAGYLRAGLMFCRKPHPQQPL